MRNESCSRKQDAPACTVNDRHSQLSRFKADESLKTGAGALTVLKEISFSLPQGSTCSILGPSGSGKTTLLGLCAGLDRPTSGSVLLNGEPLADMDEDARALTRNEHVGFVFQSFHLIPTLTALEHVTVPMELRGDGPQRRVELLKRRPRQALRIFSPRFGL